MKKLFSCSLGVLAALLTACASGRQVAVLARVGPPPFEQARHTPQGELVVYSAFETENPVDPEAVAPHSDYTIYSAAGKRLEHVNNGSFVKDPEVVSLAPWRKAALRLDSNLTHEI